VRGGRNWEESRIAPLRASQVLTVNFPLISHPSDDKDIIRPRLALLPFLRKTSSSDRVGCHTATGLPATDDVDSSVAQETDAQHAAMRRVEERSLSSILRSKLLTILINNDVSGKVNARGLRESFGQI
jgi:hypothetical protein